MGNEVNGEGTTPFMHAFLNETLKKGLISDTCMHSYNNDGGMGWSKPGFLNETLTQARFILRDIRAHSASTNLWCGECGPHNQACCEMLTPIVIYPTTVILVILVQYTLVGFSHVHALTSSGGRCERHRSFFFITLVRRCSWWPRTARGGRVRAPARA